MKKRLYILFLMFCILSVAFSSVALSAEKARKKSETPSIDFRAGINMAFSNTKINIDHIGIETENSLTYSLIAFTLEADIMDYLSLGVMAGFNSNHFKDPVDFYQLPLSLGFSDKKNGSMVFGLTAASEFFYTGDFSLAAEAEYLYFKQHENQFDITLPIVNGTATAKNQFSQLSARLLFQYDGFSTATLYAGPCINIIDGKLEAGETLESIEAEESLSYKQKQLLGAFAGIRLDVVDNLIINAQATIISGTTFSVKVVYEF